MAPGGDQQHGRDDPQRAGRGTAEEDGTGVSASRDPPKQGKISTRRLERALPRLRCRVFARECLCQAPTAQRTPGRATPRAGSLSRARAAGRGRGPAHPARPRQRPARLGHSHIVRWGNLSPGRGARVRGASRSARGGGRKGAGRMDESPRAPSPVRSRPPRRAARAAPTAPRGAEGGTFPPLRLPARRGARAARDPPRQARRGGCAVVNRPQRAPPDARPRAPPAPPQRRAARGAPLWAPSSPVFLTWWWAWRARTPWCRQGVRGTCAGLMV